MRREWYLSTLLAAVCSVSANAAVWVVDPGGGGDFTTIQAALTAAASGDEVVVQPGIYLENVSFLGKGIYLHSAAGAGQTTIDGSAGPAGAGSCVTMDGCPGTAKLEGFALTGGHGTEYVTRVLEDLDSPMVGGAVYCRDCSPEIRACEIVGNECDYAAGVFVDNGNPVLDNCSVHDNTAVTYGGGIAGPGAAPHISNCLFQDNAAETGDGTVHVTGAAIIEDCVFRGNAARAGAALNAPSSGANYQVARCLFEGNHAHGTHGGAIRVHEASVVLTECLFVGNLAAEDGGGAVVLDGGHAHFSHCTFYANEAGRFGGGIAIWSWASVVMEHSILALSVGGGGVYANASSASVYCCDVWGNAGGNFVGLPDPTGQDGNLSEDPLFCGAAGGDFTLGSDSPCAPAANPVCGQIGAYPVGCGATPSHAMNWGSVKALFLR